jgi:DNA repair protein RecO (recombination protein O)
VNQIQTRAIILSRTDYGEADRIITVLTPEQGKLSLMARGVRRVKSKLAGGIELFSVAEISYMKGRGQIDTLTSARLVHYYASIVQDIDRVQLGYELIKLLHRGTEDQPEAEYFELLEAAFIALDTAAITTDLIRIWFQAQLLRYAGHSPNLKTDTSGNKLTAGQRYSFDFETVAFMIHPEGHFSSDHIKFLRLIFNGNSPQILSHISGLNDLLPDCLPLVHTMLQTYIRI